MDTCFTGVVAGEPERKPCEDTDVLRCDESAASCCVRRFASCEAARRLW